jgi:uncharacterized protein CbrC (UPF0167 family)
MVLPVFRYHPDPIASGSIVASDALCICCGKQRGFLYVGPAYSVSETRDRLCPWCIADGSAHRKFDVCFTSEDFPEDILPEIVDEVAHRTPGFSGWQQKIWLTCCADAAAFLEPVGYAEIRARHPQLEAKLLAHCERDLRMSHEAAVRAVQELNLKHGPTAYGFICRHCGERLAYFDYT